MKATLKLQVSLARKLCWWSASIVSLAIRRVVVRNPDSVMLFGVNNGDHWMELRSANSTIWFSTANLAVYLYSSRLWITIHQVLQEIVLDRFGLFKTFESKDLNQIYQDYAERHPCKGIQPARSISLYNLVEPHSPTGVGGWTEFLAIEFFGSFRIQIIWWDCRKRHNQFFSVETYMRAS